MKKFLLNEVTESFLYLTTGIGFLLTLMMGMMEAPDNIITPVAIITIGLGVLCAYYGTWRGIQRRKGF